MSQVTLQGNASGTGVFTVAAPNSNTNRTLTLPDATGTVVTTDATQTLTNKSISGAQINSGTVAVARLGSGTPGTGNFLRGDGSWQTVPASAPSTTDVLNATAGASVGAVGTYAWLGETADVDTSAGGTRAGSGLHFAGIQKTSSDSSRVSWAANIVCAISYAPLGAGGAAAGTWRCMGNSQSGTFVDYITQSARPATLWLRIS
jgi:hypothetical protein